MATDRLHVGMKDTYSNLSWGNSQDSTFITRSLIYMINERLNRKDADSNLFMER
jgi:hypothetical protein